MDNLALSFKTLTDNLIKENGFTCQTVVKGTEIYYYARDILEHFEYSNDERKVSKVLGKLPNVCKFSLKDLFPDNLPSNDPNHTYINSLTEKQMRRLFLNKSGLYKLVLSSRKESTQKFKDFITDTLLPALDKHAIHLLENRNNRINCLEATLERIEKSNQEILNINKNLEKTNQEILDTNKRLEDGSKKLESQNSFLIDLAKKQNIKLDNLDYNIKKIIPNRNIPPTDEELQHYIALIHENSNHYKFLRGQKSYIERKIRENNYELIIDATPYPNPIDFINRLKEKSFDTEEILREKIERHIKKIYPNLSKENHLAKSSLMFEKNKKYEIRGNILYLYKTKVSEFKKIFLDTIAEQEQLEQQENI